MNISMSSVMASLLFSTIGFWLFREGRKRVNIRVILISVLLMAYTYFTSAPVADWGIGLVLCAAAYFFWE